VLIQILISYESVFVKITLLKLANVNFLMRYRYRFKMTLTLNASQSLGKGLKFCQKKFPKILLRRYRYRYKIKEFAKTDSCQDNGDPLLGKRIVMLSASHTVRMANILSIPGWRITSENVNSQVQQLSSVLSESLDGDTYIIYHLFDNSVGEQ
jgi:hypothetical protein